MSIGTVSTPSARGNSRKCRCPEKSCLACSHKHGPLPMTQPQSAKHKPAQTMSRNFLIIPISVASSLHRSQRLAYPNYGCRKVRERCWLHERMLYTRYKLRG